MAISPAAFLAAVIRTACAGHTVSMMSSQATGALASGLTHYIHADPAGTGLIIDPEFLNLKDFVGTAFKGTLGATMAYLRMLHEGYVWFGHYEESLLAPLSSNVAQPDFVFTNGSELAIVEAKGTGKNLNAADSAAKHAYLSQIHTAADRTLASGSDPTEGYAFGTALNVMHGGLPLEMACVHYTFPPKLPAAIAGMSTRGFQIPGNSQSVVSVKQLNYDTAMRQADLTRHGIDRILATSRGDNHLHIGPELASVRTGAQVLTAAVAMPHGLLRSIRDSSLPERFGRLTDSGLPRVAHGGVQGYTFVTFSDHVRVVLKERDAGPWTGSDDLIG